MFARIYIIACVASEGFYSGRETMLFIGTDLNDVIRKAYEHYKYSFTSAKADDLLDDLSEEITPFDEFEITMKAGFSGYDDYIYIQMVNSHIQYEPSSVECVFQTELIDGNTRLAVSADINEVELWKPDCVIPTVLQIREVFNNIMRKRGEEK